jgi:hypothetical protein
MDSLRPPHDLEKVQAMPVDSSNEQRTRLKRRSQVGVSEALEPIPKPRPNGNASDSEVSDCAGLLSCR